MLLDLAYSIRIAMGEENWDESAGMFIAGIGQMLVVKHNQAMRGNVQRLLDDLGVLEQVESKLRPFPTKMSPGF